jgi:hypothetical protein
LALLLLGQATGQRPLGFTMEAGKKKVVIPVEVHNNLVVVPVLLNGQLPLKFILDTGVRTAILTQKSYSDILNLIYTRKYTIAGPGIEKEVHAYVTNNVTLDLPGVRGEGHALLVLEEDYLELRGYLGVDVHGILGYELFSRFVAQIDYQARELTLHLPGRFKPPRRFQMLPIQVLDTKPYVVASIQQADSTDLALKLLIDTGASHSLFLESWTDKRIHIPHPHISSVVGRGLGGVITGKIGRLNSIILGRYKLERPLASFPDLNTYLDTLKGPTVSRNGTIGGEVLSRFKVVLDFPGEKLYLKKNSSFRSRFYFNLSGLTVKADGYRLRKYKVTDVRTGSTGERAGILPGDIILAVNGLSVSEIDLSTLNGYLNSKPGRRVRLEIERNGIRQKIAFRLVDQI